MKSLQEYKDKERRLHQDNQFTRMSERAGLLDLVQETEENAKQSIIETQAATDREKEKLYKKFSAYTQQQQRSNELLLQETERKYQTQLAESKQEALFELKAQKRTATNKQNEIIHDYEKKLTDQKTDHEFKIQELKTENNLALKELEEKFKDELKKSMLQNDFQVKQSKAQSEERERVLKEKHQDELDKVRHSHELLSKKKS